MTIYLSYKEYITGGGVCEGQEDYPWPDREDTFIEFYITGVSTIRPQNHWLVEALDVAIKEGDKIWIVVARYSDADTFGRTYGCWKIVGVCDSENKANDLKAITKAVPPMSGLEDIEIHCQIISA